jgi:hypothetical protein
MRLSASPAKAAGNGHKNRLSDAERSALVFLIDKNRFLGKIVFSQNRF